MQWLRLCTHWLLSYLTWGWCCGHLHRYYGPQLQLVELQERLRSLEDTATESAVGTDGAVAEVVVVCYAFVSFTLSTNIHCLILG